MNFNHEPVMIEKTIELLKPESAQVIVDGTMGGAGHSLRIINSLPPEGILVGIDQDPDAYEAGKSLLEAYGNKAKVFNDNFVNIKHICERIGIHYVDGILLDLGVSSYQLDNKDRGFTYQENAPLDMRMDKSQKITASEVVNTYSEQKLAEIIREYGEEKWAQRIAQFIVQARQDQEINTTQELVKVIKAAIPKGARKSGPHPAKRTFQALRIHVNGELDSLRTAIQEGIRLLRGKGRFVVITFHSLEDRIVKQEFKKLAQTCVCPTKLPICQCKGEATVKLLTKKPLLPSQGEIEINPRARSAKLRAVERLGSNN
ncbi:16S rRNA (cytosine(1402)-N(4))-methyltransferase RsmH [Natranaerobius thermophilus]|uniref:Ribosomal RNA small subunit methyltransferase H n=1 Tax=Natranaerobius thermophilus (strain ATCC BAA-1301 / DSM 18059 / JW/NM-WN-LF) TaxID=457570 RepID=RSMH_NATTJ|nr:16S rRNA (cytosine(1402)-N(4))-methyltransferase RsmH [Natranaerobius thermophilus]B2A2G4.1 RecName: Full=Ribosomal RNA small subunit methyltransferase H; AltName: Full=16S rRNA m(4)C1402 methyltransferase; AltName: Full=rRNA (cytosine-N(4)-)-methyltransferase RsmH [Natranaerobius thermophilus JW/NM-WN-LF]ACB84879.1 S-adenosyl-methyltransferase MraW [Natranaerobius thermophilus JW/NM-WN-LF]